ncbi:hypothetical protein J1605_010202, partial [Eschrichtius robustus]
INSIYETSTFGRKLILIISFQDELIKAITARSARQRSSEYSDDFDSDEIENNSSLEADNHFKPSPRPRSMLKKHSHREEKDSLGEDKDTALHEELEAHSAPSFLSSLNGRQPEAEKNAFSENLDPEGRTLGRLSLHFTMVREVPPHISEGDAWLTSLSSSSLKESLRNSSSPGSGEKASITDQNEECTENHNSLKSIESEENSFLIDFVTALEKPKESQVTTGDLEEEKEKAELIMNDDLTVDDPPLFQLQNILCTESAKKIIEDRNMKNKKSTNNRASNASGRLVTSEFLKKPGSLRRTPLTVPTSHYLGTLRILDQKPSQKQNTEPDRADNIRAAVYQVKRKILFLKIRRINHLHKKKAAKREEALASFEAWKAMKEKEAKKVAAKKRLEEKNQKKTEEENAVRKREALQVCNGFEYLNYF